MYNIGVYAKAFGPVSILVISSCILHNIVRDRGCVLIGWGKWGSCHIIDDDVVKVLKMLLFSWIVSHVSLTLKWTHALHVHEGQPSKRVAIQCGIMNIVNRRDGLETH